MYAKQSQSPVLFKSYGAISEIFSQSTLSQIEQLVVSMAASHSNDCDFCITAHSWLGRYNKIEEGVITALREDRPLESKKLQALREFTVALTVGRGQISNTQREDFFSAGYNTEQALEVITGIAAKVMTNYTNSLAHTPPNSEFGEENIWKSVEN